MSSTLLGIGAAGVALLVLVVLWQRTASQIARLQASLRAVERKAPSLIEQAELLDLAYDAILVWELKTGAIGFWNQSSANLYGWEKSEVLGRTPQAILPSSDQPSIHSQAPANRRPKASIPGQRRGGYFVYSALSVKAQET